MFMRKGYADAAEALSREWRRQPALRPIGRVDRKRTGEVL
jgi:hypothetical protein